MGDTFHGRKGNSPDRQLRSLNTEACEVDCTDSQDVGLEAATI